MTKLVMTGKLVERIDFFRKISRFLLLVREFTVLSNRCKEFYLRCDINYSSAVGTTALILGYRADTKMKLSQANFFKRSYRCWNT